MLEVQVCTVLVCILVSHCKWLIEVLALTNDSNLFCQKSDWKQHKAECKALVFSESNFSLLKVCGAFSGEEALLDDARILLRLSGVLLNDSTNCETVTRMDCADSIVRCGVSHVMDMSSVPQENSNHTHDDYPLAVKIVSNILSKVCQSFL